MENLTEITEKFVDLCYERNVEKDNCIGMYLTIVKFDRPNAEKNLQSFIEWIKAHPEADDCAMIDYIQDYYI